MKILVAHNRYLFRGGEDVVFEAETQLLRDKGHEVLCLEEDNARIGAIGALRSAARAVWSRESYRRVVDRIGEFRPDILHVHNFHPLLSPSIFHAARAGGVPSVLTLHNYRLICLGGQLLRNGRICEDCLSARSHLPGVFHRCYRNSLGASGATAAMLNVHRWKGTWRKAVGRYIAVSNFARETFIRGGLPAERVVVKPHFISRDPGIGEGSRDYALFLGRLSHEKGLSVLLDAWDEVRPPYKLLIAGDGPDRERVTERTRGMANVECLGQVPSEQALHLLQTARYLVFPSIVYETFGLSILEAYAAGTPVIATRLGSMRELVEEGTTGHLFAPGDARDLAEKLRWCDAHADAVREMGRNGRRLFETRFTADRNHDQLMRIYADAMADRKR